jgi:uncharacterized protein (DUF362 family)/Pyruvate/2-oxoacid:ferredoxin oxidoreductase delta subunit
MNNKVAARRCKEYDIHDVISHISDIYKTCDGPELNGRRVLVKPNILSDSIPEKCITTHPVVVEAMVKFLQSENAVVFLGDSPAVHTRGFRAEKSEINRVCEETGVPWVDFTVNPSEIKLNSGKIKIASVINDVDLIISLPKLKNHELVYFTGAIKNTLGLVPGFSKTKQHAKHQDRESFSRFLVDLNEAVTPHFFLMDGITGMEGRGPGQGTPVSTEVLIGSTNPLALDIIAATIAGYSPKDIPTNHIALSRRKWLLSAEGIEYDGPVLQTIIKKDFKRIAVTPNTNIVIKFLKNRLKFFRKLDKRPVFMHKNCTGCNECIKICPHNAIVMHPDKKNFVMLTDQNCIRCYCCSEVCKYQAVIIRRKPFGI